MYEEFFRALHNTLVVLGGDDELLAIIGKDTPLDEMTRKLHSWNSNRLEDAKLQLLKFKGIDVVVKR